MWIKNEFGYIFISGLIFFLFLSITGIYFLNISNSFNHYQMCILKHRHSAISKISVNADILNQISMNNKNIISFASLIIDTLVKNIDGILELTFLENTALLKNQNTVNKEKIINSALMLSNDVSVRSFSTAAELSVFSEDLFRKINFNNVLNFNFTEKYGTVDVFCFAILFLNKNKNLFNKFASVNGNDCRIDFLVKQKMLSIIDLLKLIDGWNFKSIDKNPIYLNFGSLKNPELFMNGLKFTFENEFDCDQSNNFLKKFIFNFFDHKNQKNNKKVLTHVAITHPDLFFINSLYCDRKDKLLVIDHWNKIGKTCFIDKVGYVKAFFKPNWVPIFLDQEFI